MDNPDSAATYTTADFLAQWQRVKEASAELEGPSLAIQLAAIEAERPGFVEGLLNSLQPEQWQHLAYDPEFWLRPKQLKILHLGRAGGVLYLILIAGRGNGKTRTVSELVIDRLERGARRIVLVGPSYDTAKEYLIGGVQRRCEGENGSGLLDCLPPWIPFNYKADEYLIEFPKHHAELRIHSAEVPEYRGPAPDTVCGDEVIKWRYPNRLISNLRLACRSVGKLEPMIALITSPKRLRLLRDLVMDPDFLTIHAHANENRGNTHDRVYQSNLRRLTDPKTGQLTRQGLEELGGELGVDDEGDMFPLGIIEQNRQEPPGTLDIIGISIDPAGSTGRRSDDTGLVAIGRLGDIDTGEAYVLEDGSGALAWEVWGERAFEMAEKHGASLFILERNKFADSVAANIRTTGNRRGYDVRPQPGKKHLVELVHAREGKDLKGKTIKPTNRVIKIVEIIQSASTGDKATRAEPVSTLYKTGRVRHVCAMPELDAELSEWNPANGSFSPGRIDAIVTGVIEMFRLDRPPTLQGASLKGLTELNAKADPPGASQLGRGAQWLTGGRDRGRSI